MCIVAAPRPSQPEPHESSAESLQAAFVKDHQILTRGFRDLLDALDRHDDASASAIADHLDRAAGAHIDFEEHDYYPALRTWLGRQRVEEMYEEHDIGLSAIRMLSRRPAGAGLSPAERARTIADVRLALDHAIDCGATLAHVETLDEERQGKLLAALLAARKRGRRWSELERDLPAEV